MNRYQQAKAFKASTIAHITQQLELEASCVVTVQEVGDDYDGEWQSRGYRAWANRGGFMSHTVATSLGDTAIEALDNLARELGYDPDVEAMITRPAATVAGSVNLLTAIQERAA